jgi:hypothetical protein
MIACHSSSGWSTIGRTRPGRRWRRRCAARRGAAASATDRCERRRWSVTSHRMGDDTCAVARRAARRGRLRRCRRRCTVAPSAWKRSVIAAADARRSAGDERELWTARGSRWCVSAVSHRRDATSRSSLGSRCVASRCRRTLPSAVRGSDRRRGAVPSARRTRGACSATCAAGTRASAAWPDRAPPTRPPAAPTRVGLAGDGHLGHPRVRGSAASTGRATRSRRR